MRIICILLWSLFFFSHCSGVKNKIEVNSISMSFIQGKDIKIRTEFSGDSLHLDDDEGLLVLKFNLNYYGNKDRGPFSGSVEPGLDGVDKKINELKIINQKNDNITFDFKGINLDFFKLDGRNVCINFTPSLEYLKDEINRKSKRYIGTDLGCYFVFKYNTKKITDTTNLKVLISFF